MDEKTELHSRPGISGGALRSLILALVLIPWTVLWGSWAIVFGILGSGRMPTWGITVWSRGILLISGVRVEVIRKGELKPDQPYVFFINHQSALDIPILFQACRGHQQIRFMAKESLFKIPFIGWGMSLTGFIPIRRENARHSAEQVQGLKQSKKSFGYSYIVFPEGTRSPDGRLQAFKKGSIGMAQRLGLPLAPVTIVDACRANPKGTYRVRTGTVRVVFHEPIPIAADAPAIQGRAARDALAQNIFDTVASALPEEQKPLPQIPANDSQDEQAQKLVTR